MLLCFSDRQTQGQTGRLTDSMRITDGRTDARWYSGYVVRHWTGMASNGTPLRHTHGQLPHATVRAEQRQTDALLSAGKMLHPCTHTQKNTHTHMHTHSVLCSSPSILHLSAPCCQRARQEVMFVPSGTVIFSFSPLLTHVSFLLLFSPLLSFPLHFCVAFTVKKKCYRTRNTTSERQEWIVEWPVYL